MVRYLQASDIHGTDRVQKIIDTANAVGNLDAVMLLGDLVDKERPEYARGNASKGYEYQDLLYREIDRVNALQDRLSQDILSQLSESETLAFQVEQQVARLGGKARLEGALEQLGDSDLGMQARELLDAYNTSTSIRESVDEKIAQLELSDTYRERTMEFLNARNQLPDNMMRTLVDRQIEDRATLDRIFQASSAPVYVGEGNHDGQALQGLKHATNMADLSYALDIGGVTFAYEPNTRENILGVPFSQVPGLSNESLYEMFSSFYDGLHSMIGADMATRDILSRLEDKGFVQDSHKSAKFKKDFLNDSPIYSRLSAIGPVDVFLMHNPIGQHANVPRRDGPPLFIDYSYAVGEYVRMSKPGIIGWGHIHGGGGHYAGADPTFGYDYMGIHSTDDVFFVVDVDPETKKVRWVETFEFVD